MSHFIGLPAAIQVLWCLALAPTISTFPFVAAKSLSIAVAVTSINSLVENLRAVSFTTAKAVGRIANKTSSINLFSSFSKTSMLSYNETFSDISISVSLSIRILIAAISEEILVI